MWDAHMTYTPNRHPCLSGHLTRTETQNVKIYASGVPSENLVHIGC